MSKLLSDEKRRSLWLEFNVDYETIYAIEAAVLEAQGKQKPVAWMVVTADDKLVFINANQAEHYAKQWELEVCPLFAAPVVQEKQEPWPFSKEGDPLYAAPVVQPDMVMVMVPREPTEAMLDAAMNRYQHVSPEAKARYTQMHRENFRCDYKAMIAAAEGKSNANVCGLPHGKESK